MEMGFVSQTEKPMTGESYWQVYYIRHILGGNRFSGSFSGSVGTLRVCTGIPKIIPIPCLNDPLHALSLKAMDSPPCFCNYLAPSTDLDIVPIHHLRPYGLFLPIRPALGQRTDVLRGLHSEMLHSLFLFFRQSLPNFWLEVSELGITLDCPRKFWVSLPFVPHLLCHRLSSSEPTRLIPIAGIALSQPNSPPQLP